MPCTDDKQIRSVWRLRWLASIQELADLHEQQRTWLDTHSGNPHASFIEYVCCYFDDLGLSDQNYSKFVADGFVTEHESKLLQDFHTRIELYKSPTNDWDHASILSDPKWHRITELARIAKAELLEILSEPSERSALITGSWQSN